MSIALVAADRGPWPLHDIAASRAAEAAALGVAQPHVLMQRAGFAVARLALALAPRARRFAVFAGPGNNGGDGLVAATRLHERGHAVQVLLLADAARLPADAADAWAGARAAGVAIVDRLADLAPWDLAVDALLGLGSRRAPEGGLAQAIAAMNVGAAPVLAVDLPSGLHAETGNALGEAVVKAAATLSLLTLKPGLFTGQGRDLAGAVWLDRLGTTPAGATAELGAAPAALERPHASHKGSYGDVAVVGGAPGMAGAAWLAARAALAAGAGRVYAGLLDETAGFDPSWPELMLRRRWWSGEPALLARTTVACGCGGGDAVREALPALISGAGRLVLDADALNAIAADAALQTLLERRAARALPTILTPHPLEAARLLATDAASVQRDRVAAALALAGRFGAVVVLKGSGSVVAAPDALPSINPTGNALLATAGSGDVLAGWIAGSWAARAEPARECAIGAVWQHGRAADLSQARGRHGALAAGELVEALRAL